MQEGGRHLKVPQIGNVEIEDDAEIGANVTIDRGALGPTHIGKGTKVDNLVQIAHNVSTGENCLVVAQAGIAGSTKLGNSVILPAKSVWPVTYALATTSPSPPNPVMRDINDGENGGHPGQPTNNEAPAIALQKLPEPYAAIIVSKNSPNPAC